MKIKLKTSITFLVLFLIVFPTFPSDFDSGSEKVIDHVINDDFYVSGGTITVNAKIEGDLVAVGGTVILNDSIYGDALLGGGTLRLNGYIGDDVRAAGGNIKIDKNVHGDLLVAGGEVEISPGVIIFGDLISMGGKTRLNGSVKGRARLLGGEIYLNGKVEGNLDVKGGKLFVNGQMMGKSSLAAKEISIQGGARFHQDVAYWQESGPINFDQAMVSGKSQFRPDLQLANGNSHWYYLGFGSVAFLVVYLSSVLLLLFILQYIFTNLLMKAGETFNDNKVKFFGYGLAYLIGLPIVSLFLFLTVIGIPLGVFTLTFYLFTIALAYVITALVLAHWYRLTYNTGWNKQNTVWAALAIFIFIKLLALAPVAGWLVSIVLIGTAFGTIIDSLRPKRQRILVV